MNIQDKDNDKDDNIGSDNKCIEIGYKRNKENDEMEIYNVDTNQTISNDLDINTRVQHSKIVIIDSKEFKGVHQIQDSEEYKLL